MEKSPGALTIFVIFFNDFGKLPTPSRQYPALPVEGGPLHTPRVNPVLVPYVKKRCGIR